ncbi:MAG: epoxyqueuosine reductase QueH, partial [Clostridia bacterium]|nr:epoxyqueuosine reductase QueH [Clostridia bacterium]
MVNYAKLFEEEAARALASGRKPRLLLHACCAPCSSRCLEVLDGIYEITVYFYNPNIA